MDPLKSFIRKLNRSKNRHHDHNPFQDVRIVHEDFEDRENITVHLEVSEELDIVALEKLIAELFASDMVKNKSIRIDSRYIEHSTNIEYRGSITLLK